MHSVMLAPWSVAGWAGLGMATRARAAVDGACSTGAAAPLLAHAAALGERALPRPARLHLQLVHAEALMAGHTTDDLQRAYTLAAAVVAEPDVPLPYSALAYVVAARVQAAVGDAGGAAHALQQAVASDPSHVAGWEELARLYEAAGDAASAGQCAAQAVVAAEAAWARDGVRHPAPLLLRQARAACARGDADGMLAAARAAAATYNDGTETGATAEAAPLAVRLWLGLALAVREGAWRIDGGARPDARALARPLRTLQAVLASDPQWPPAQWAVGELTHSTPGASV
jgi:tetratricopeptide (TPR) repeat protein